MLIAWYPIAPEKGSFLEDENGAYLPRNEIQEAIESAVIFYMIKKDKTLENRVKKIILNTDTKPKLKTLAKEIKKEVFSHTDILEDLEIKEKIYLPKEGIKQRVIKRYSFEKGEFIEHFQSEVFEGVIEEDIVKSPHIEKLKIAMLSYARGLAEQEHKLLKESSFEPLIEEIQNQIANEWEATLRIGAWTKTPYKGDLLFFWRIKEVREKLLRDFHLDIRPKDILFIPQTKTFLGWSELKA